MIYRILFSNKAEKALSSYHQETRNRIVTALENLLWYLNDREGTIQPDIRNQKGKYAGLFRLRVGKYRVVFRMEDNKLIIFVIEIDNRGDIY